MVRDRLTWDSEDALADNLGYLLPGTVARLDQLARARRLTRDGLLLLLIRAIDQGTYRDGHHAREFLNRTLGPEAVYEADAAIHAARLEPQPPRPTTLTPQPNP